MRIVVLLAGLSLFLLLAVTGVIVCQSWSTRDLIRIGDGEDPDTYGFDFGSSPFARENLVASGQPLGGIEALVYPPVMEAEEMAEYRGRSKYLVPHDLVIGVVEAGRARAYPLHILQWHEVVNDTLGGRPIAVTYSPLSFGIAVFDRRVAGRRLEFGVSGLLYNSNLLFYDRGVEHDVSVAAGAGGATEEGTVDGPGAEEAGAEEAGAEDVGAEEVGAKQVGADRRPPIQPGHEPSLWSQLWAAPVAGPALHRGDSLEEVPCALTTWEDWLARHPDTQVLRRDDRLLTLYKRKPYSVYFGNDEIRFPTSPLPPHETRAYKTLVVSVAAGSERRLFSLDSRTSPADSPASGSPMSDSPMSGSPDAPATGSLASGSEAIASWAANVGGIGIRLHTNEDPDFLWAESADGDLLPSRYAFWFAWHAHHPGTEPVHAASGF